MIEEILKVIRKNQEQIRFAVTLRDRYETDSPPESLTVNINDNYYTVRDPNDAVAILDALVTACHFEIRQAKDKLSDNITSLKTELELR